MAVTVKELEDELITVIKTMKAFKDKAYSIYDLEDLERMTEGQTNNLPIVGVGYNGAEPTGNQVDPKMAIQRQATGIAFGNLRFVVVIAVQYPTKGVATDADEDTKHHATELLDEIRARVIGYKGKNTRAWRWMGESPEPTASGDGLIFYSQWWETSAPMVGAQINA